MITGWDFTKATHRIALVIEVNARRPEVLVLSPPCTMFSSLMHLNWWKLLPDVREAKFQEAVIQVEACCLLMDLQISAGRKVVFEHPQRSLSWLNARLSEINACDQVRMVNFDQCQFGLVSPIERIPLRKSTTILTSLPQMRVKLMGKKCKVATSIKSSMAGKGRSS